jgi:hypothetical protein
LGKNNSASAAQLEKRLLKEFDEKYNRVTLKDETSRMLVEFEKQEIQRLKDESERVISIIFKFFIS